jgi:hypothetical protein
VDHCTRSRLVFGRCYVRISTVIPAILIEAFRSFSQFLQQNAGILSQSGQANFIPNLLQFTSQNKICYIRNGYSMITRLVQTCFIILTHFNRVGIHNTVCACLFILRPLQVRFIIVNTQFQNTLVTKCRASTRCMNVSYVMGHERARSLFVSQRLVSSVSTGNILM